MKIEYHRYCLRSREQSGALSSRSDRSEFEGALIRVDGLGVGCIHPWTELGDALLEDELAGLACDRPLRLGEAALDCSTVDGAARRDGRSLFADLEIPASHWTAAADDDPEAVVDRGFSVVKLKLGGDIDDNVRRVELWAGASGIESLRLDANEAMNAKTVVAFAAALGETARRKVEFFEDPLPFDVGLWEELQAKTELPFALDRKLSFDRRGIGWHGVCVIKPAIQALPKLLDWQPPTGSRLIFTSYMDHAIGQLWAAWCAAELGAVGTHGLMTNFRFEADEFFSRLACEGDRLLAPQGTGLGMDDLLEELPWKLLS